MGKRCPIYKYQCVDGKCVNHSIKCDSSWAKCGSLRRGAVYCGKKNGDNCVTSDRDCMRPCGFSNLRHYNYTKPCLDYPGKCAYSSRYCVQKPKPCRSDEKRCSNGTCVKYKGYCDICMGYRCQDTGKCYDFFRKCNNIPDCLDRSDELNCPKTNDRPRQDSGYDSLEMLLGSLGAAILITLMILRGWWMLNKSRRRHQEEAAILASNRRLSQYEPARPVRGGAGQEFEMPRMPVTPANDNLGFVPVTRPTTGYSFQEPAGPLPTVAPPPSYSEVVTNQDQYKRADPELPTYEESAHFPPTHPP
ncbi:uncharacterized protein LOC135496382 [Lineus longissimus]|uniref:uncharacterized protein LOC135496382 n=1 Tax=Lineus longissimus TaxID=88925 RepID=UPI002B4EFBE6